MLKSRQPAENAAAADAGVVGAGGGLIKKVKNK